MKNLIIIASLIVLSAESFAQDKGKEKSAVKSLTESLKKLSPSADLCVVTPDPLNDVLDAESQKIADKKWYAGAKDCYLPAAKEPRYEVLEVNPGFYILRQNKCVNFEAPFVYLTIGSEGALLFDTGATSSLEDMNLRGWVDGVLKIQPNGDKLKLVVAHSHSHGDHTAGDEQFTNRPNTSVVGLDPSEVAKAFNVKNWPTSNGEIDLGNRKLTILPIPGHEESSIAVYDHNSHDMLTGDTLYPGNVFLSDESWPEFSSSIERLHKFSETHPIRNILGAHIEMSDKAKVEYPYGSTFHPEEHKLPLYQRHLDEVYKYTQQNKKPKETKFDDIMLTL